MRQRLTGTTVRALWLIGVLVILEPLSAFGKTAISGPSGSSETLLPGLSKSDWRAIRQEYERHRHAAFEVAGGYRARNHRQQWVTHFDGQGFEVQPDGAQWTWGLQLESFGRAGVQRAIGGRPRVTAALERVSYEWSQGVREWWVNDGRGLEHGFTVWERPSAAGASLVLRLAVRGGLQPQVQEGGQAASFVDATGQSVVNYSGLKVWDADGQVLTSRMQIVGAALQMEVDERSALYPLTIDPVAQQVYLKASNTEASGLFGSSIAVSGDTVVVGAWADDSSATGVNGNQSDNSAPNSGAAYVFVRNAGVWSQQAYLKASNTGADDLFGWSVAVSGDTVVVGAWGEDSSATEVNGNQSDNSAPASGAAYVFVRNGGAWTQQAYLKGSNTREGDEFAWSVAVSGNTVAVGAPGAGASYVFLIPGTIECTGCYFLSNNARLPSPFARPWTESRAHSPTSTGVPRRRFSLRVQRCRRFRSQAIRLHSPARGH